MAGFFDLEKYSNSSRQIEYHAMRQVFELLDGLPVYPRVCVKRSPRLTYSVYVTIQCLRFFLASFPVLRRLQICQSVCRLCPTGNGNLKVNKLFKNALSVLKGRSECVEFFGVQGKMPVIVVGNFISFNPHG